MTVKRLIEETARDRRLLDKSDGRVMEALEDVLRERNPDSDMAALLDERAAARGRIKARRGKKAVPPE
jgi:hypothetical protein